MTVFYLLFDNIEIWTVFIADTITELAVDRVTIFFERDVIVRHVEKVIKRDKVARYRGCDIRRRLRYIRFIISILSIL